MLSGIETTKEKVLRIILAGQPELNDKLNSKDLVQLVQRVRLRFHLAALTAAETAAYIDHRLEVAGSQGRRIFGEDTYPTIYRYTGGVPRLVNTLCDTCMMAAFGRDSDSVDRGRISMPRSASCSGPNSPRAPIACGCSMEAMLPRARRMSGLRWGASCLRAAGRPCWSASFGRAAWSSAERRTTTCRSTANSSAAITARS